MLLLFQRPHTFRLIVVTTASFTFGRRRRRPQIRVLDERIAELLRAVPPLLPPQARAQS